MDKLKRLISWSLSSWVGSLVMAICLTGLFFGVKFVLAKGSAKPRPNISASQIINNWGFAEQWKQLVPEWFGVDKWSVGQYAKYALNDYNGVERTPEFQVVGKLDQDHKVARVYKLNARGYFWMKSKGFRYFRDLPGSDFQLVTATDTRLKDKNHSFEILDGYIPLKNNLLTGYPVPDRAPIERLGREKITTEAGDFVCDIYQADLDGVILKIWANPMVPPLGIVRMTSERETLELTSYSAQTDETEIPAMFQPVIDGFSTVAYGCESCHASDADLHTPVYPPK